MMYIFGQVAAFSFQVFNKTALQLTHNAQHFPRIPTASLLAKQSNTANQVWAPHFLDYDAPPSSGREAGAWITSDPSNALIEVGVCVGPFMVMESVGNCPVTQIFFFIVTNPFVPSRPWPSASKKCCHVVTEELRPIVLHKSCNFCAANLHWLFSSFWCAPSKSHFFMTHTHKKSFQVFAQQVNTNILILNLALNVIRSRNDKPFDWI